MLYFNSNPHRRCDAHRRPSGRLSLIVRPTTKSLVPFVSPISDSSWFLASTIGGAYMFIPWGLVCAIYVVLVGLCVLLALIPDTRRFAYRITMPLAFLGLLSIAVIMAAAKAS
jgi:hypothetical protein